MVLNVADMLEVNKEMSELISALVHKSKITDPSCLQKMLDTVLSVMNEQLHITVTDCNGTIIYANDLYCQLSQYTKEELIGQNHRLVNCGKHSKLFFQQLWETIQSGNIWRGEMQNQAKDSTTFTVYAIIVPILNKEQPARFVSFQTDISKKRQLEKQFKTDFVRTFQNLQNGIFKVRKEHDGTLIYTMSEGRLMDEIGANTQVLYAKSPYDVFSLEIAKFKEPYYLKAFEGQRVHYELELNGILIYVDLEPITYNGVVTEIVGTVYDFSEFRDVQKQLKVKEERYQSLMNYSHEYIMMLDQEGLIKQMNPKIQALFNVAQIAEQQVNLFNIMSEESATALRCYFEKAVRGEVQFFEFEVKTCKQRTCLNITLVPTVMDNEIDGIYLIGKDITEEKIVQERNAYLAHHDELTGLPNRRWMEQKIQHALQNANDNPNIAILFLDLDRFKSINDTLGHVVGDELLQQIAKRLQTNRYHQKIHVARMGGDELMVLCPNFEAKAEVTEIAENILHSLEKPFHIQGFELLVTVSIGIVFCPATKTDVTELMKSVDIALYKAKELGRNMYQIYDGSMNSENYQSFVMERDLRKALLNDEFVIYLQPKVQALTEEVVGAEALIRWNHPEFGIISPGEFIPLAEETGIILAIGKWVQQKICEQLVTWRNAGYALIPISINISSNRFLQQGFASEIRELLSQFELAGEWLEIEITENSIMRNEEMVQKTLTELKEMGVKIFIDDFGTGYSSFNYLKTFEIDGIKIDRSFIQNIANNQENASITSAMIKMAQQLRLEVIAEGVETKEELDYLIGENCYYIQGFYFGKPCAIQSFEQTYLQNNC